MQHGFYNDANLLFFGSLDFRCVLLSFFFFSIVHTASLSLSLSDDDHFKEQTFHFPRHTQKMAYVKV